MVLYAHLTGGNDAEAGDVEFKGRNWRYVVLTLGMCRSWIVLRYVFQDCY